MCFGLFNYNLSKAQILVDNDAIGLNDGTSWEDAFRNLEDALNSANEGDQIWIASGTYLPGKSGDPKSSTFHVAKGIQLYGGFAGTETTLAERTLSKHPTILSGDLNQDDIEDDFENNRNDNVWTVMLVENKTNTIPIIDGITFKNGHSDDNEFNEDEWNEIEFNQASNGGGLYLYGPALISNCTFSQNFSSERAGALFMLDSLNIKNTISGQNQLDLKIDNCQFINNFSNSGGAVFITIEKNNGSSVAIQNSKFSKNKSKYYGGGINIRLASENGSVKIDSCNFSNNVSSLDGGGILLGFYGENNVMTVQNTELDGNQAEDGGGALFLYNNSLSANNKYKVDLCSFTNNSATDNKSGDAGGGAIDLVGQGDQNYTNIQNSNFLKNNTDGFGGAIGIRTTQRGKNIHTEINNNYFKENTASYGGGIHYYSRGVNDSLFVQSSQFISNEVSKLHQNQATKGGALNIRYSSKSKNSTVWVDDCSFEKNQSKDGDGGAVSITPHALGTFSSFSNSSFTSNSSSGKGGAFLYLGTDTAYGLKSCTFDDNQAEEGGALLYEPQTLNKSLFYIFFHGVLWVQILYSLLLFLISRERTTLYYALMMFGISLFFVVVFDRMHFPFLIGASSDTRDILYQTGVFLSVLGLMKFAQQYLNINQLIPVFKKIVFYFLSFFLFFELIFFAQQFDLLGQFGENTEALVGFALLLCFAIGGLIPIAWAIIVLMKGYKPAKYFLLAMLFSGSALLWLVISFLQTGSPTSIPIVSIESLLLLCIITLALADGYRVNLLKKDKARAERLSALDIAKTRLYTNITHEFRTPLTVIMGASDMVKGNEPEKDLIKRNSKQLLQLINQMLDLSKLEGGALKLEAQQGNIIPFIEYLVESFQSLADVKHIRLTFYQDIETLQMDYDANKMQQVITNLISNAIKFTEESGKIIVHAKEESFKGKPHLTLIVRDNGSGIPIEDLPHVFDRFFQVDASDLRHSEGSGIGLALVKELVELMKGQIEVTSKIGDGTVFTVRIPISKLAPLQGEIINANDLLLPSDPANEKEKATLFHAPADDLPLALIIEDNKDIVSFLRSCLQRNYKIEVAYNGHQGIDKALEIIPDIIISDVMMPEADGFTVCKTLKTDERTNHIPIILLTAKATQEDKVHGLDAGADAYLSKPFHKEELEVRLQKLIELRQQLQLRYQDGSNNISPAKNKEDEFIQKLRSIIEEKMEDESFSIVDLCHSIGLSRMQLHRKLKALTGMAATAFINSVRLQKAFDLLSDTDLNVSEVAYKVGFSNHSYFSKLFANKFGKSPSEINNNNN